MHQHSHLRRQHSALDVCRPPNGRRNLGEGSMRSTPVIVPPGDQKQRHNLRWPISCHHMTTRRRIDQRTLRNHRPRETAPPTLVPVFRSPKVAASAADERHRGRMREPVAPRVPSPRLGHQQEQPVTTWVLYDPHRLKECQLSAPPQLSRLFPDPSLRLRQQGATTDMPSRGKSESGQFPRVQSTRQDPQRENGP